MAPRAQTPPADTHESTVGGSPVEEWTIDELTRRSGVPVRTIREYQTMSLLPSPRRVGRIGLYTTSHLRRLGLIGRLQDRGYSLAGISDLLAQWRDGAALTDVLGLEADQLVHVDEPGAPATLTQLTELLPSLIPERLDELLDTGIVEACGPEHYCIPSPSLMQLTIDSLAAGIAPGTVLALLGRFRTAADAVADAVLDTFAQIPDGTDRSAVDALAVRGRGLLAHGLGRLTLHRIGRAVDVADDDTPAQVATRLANRHPEVRSSARTSAVAACTPEDAAIAGEP